MNALDKLKAQAPDLEFEQSDGTPVVKLGLIITLYFKEGYKSETKQKVSECFERFYEAYKEHLQWQVGCRFQKINEINFKKHKLHIENTASNEEYEWHVSSAANEKFSRDYSLQVLGSLEVHGDKVSSYIKITLPWNLILSPFGQDIYKDWLLYLCNQVKAEHGYGGLSNILPYDYHNYMPAEFQLAQQFSGLEVDSMPFASSLELIDHIKGVNWYTVLGNTYVERLGGESAIRHALSGRGDIEILNYDYGLIIRAGEYPELGAVADGPPAAYVAVNRVVRPVRIPNPDQLHSYSPYGDCFDMESTDRWYRRFDQDMEKGIPGSIHAGQPCSHEGYWSSPAQANSRRHFKQGELMPEFKDSSWGATIWYWSSES